MDKPKYDMMLLYFLCPMTTIYLDEDFLANEDKFLLDTIEKRRNYIFQKQTVCWNMTNFLDFLCFLSINL